MFGYNQKISIKSTKR